MKVMLGTVLTISVSQCRYLPLPHGREEEKAGLYFLALPANWEGGVVQVQDTVTRLLLGYVSLRSCLALDNK